MKQVTSAMVRRLYVPPAKSHKGDNGELLVIGGSTRYHGAPFLAARMASKIVDFVYFSSTPENNALVRKMKHGLSEFIAVPRREVFKYAAHSDCILMGPGLGLDRVTRVFVNTMLRTFPEKKFVLDAGALRLVDLRLLYSEAEPPIRRRLSLPRIVFTPHRQEFRAAFRVAPIPANVATVSKKYNGIIVLKGSEDVICSPRQCFVNRTGNAGMTKGGTGDVLSGLIAGLACKNDLFLSARVGAYVNGLAGDRLRKRVSYYFSASDLIEEVPRVLRTLL